MDRPLEGIRILEVAQFTFVPAAGAVLAVLVLAGPAPADEPTFNGRKLSEWLTVLKEDETPRRRRAAVVALGNANRDSSRASTRKIASSTADATGSPSSSCRTAIITPAPARRSGTTRRRCMSGRYRRGPPGDSPARRSARRRSSSRERQPQ